MRTDGRHTTITAAPAQALNYGCRSCSVTFAGTQLKVWHRQKGGGSPPLLLSATTYDPIKEDDLICPNCTSKDIFVRA